MEKPSEGTKCEVVARLAKAPEWGRTMGGVLFCRLLLVQKPAGPASKPVQIAAYTRGELAERYAFSLAVGDLIEITAKLPATVRRKARCPELIIPDMADGVRLLERAQTEKPEPEVVPARLPSQRYEPSDLVVHCQVDPYDVYIGRGRDPYTGEKGEWGNAYSHLPSKVPGVIAVASPEEAVDSHRDSIWRALKGGRLSLERLAALEGQTLGCWCRQPGPCHGHTLVAASKWAAMQLRRRQVAKTS